MSWIIREYADERGRSPFRRWLATLDTAPRARVQARILRFETGNLGDHKEVGHGIWEARLAFGAGYRVYFGKDGCEIVVLLGGDKSRQRKEIARAKVQWRRYLKEPEYGKAK